MELGLIGLGRAGSVHLAACSSVTGMDIVAVCDQSPVAREAAAAAGVTAYATVSEMLDHEHLDAVIICTPPVEHAALAIECLKNGLHVLCEKPLALHTWDAIRMFDAARR